MERERENENSLAGVADIFGTKTYSIDYVEYFDLNECKQYYEVPRFPRTYEEKKSTPDFKLKLAPRDIFKITDRENEETVYICEEFAFQKIEDVQAFYKMLKTVKRHRNLFEFIRIIVLTTEKRMWLLSWSEDLIFLKKKLNKETKNPFSLHTLMNFCRDIEGALDHLSKMKSERLSIFDDVLTPFITTTAILYSPSENTFKIGFSLAYSNHYEADKKYSPEVESYKSSGRQEKEVLIIQSLGRVMLEVAIGFFTKVDYDGKLEITGIPVSLEGGPLTDDKIRDVINETRKDMMFSSNLQQLNYFDTHHIQRILAMIKRKLSWKEAIEQHFFGDRVWSYRWIDPMQIRNNIGITSADGVETFRPEKADLKKYLLVDGINCTIFLGYYLEKGIPLTTEIWKEHLDDEQKVNRFIDEITTTFKCKLSQTKKDDALIYTFDKGLDVPSDEVKKSSTRIELMALWGKNCIVHKCLLDILTLSVEFGDDLNHLSSVIATTFPYMSTEIDEQRHIVFRIANTLSPGDRVVDMIIDTLDQMLITINTIRLKFEDCIKGEKFGRLAKASHFIADEIIEKIREYHDVKKRIIIETNRNKKKAF